MATVVVVVAVVAAVAVVATTKTSVATAMVGVTDNDQPKAEWWQ